MVNGWVECSITEVLKPNGIKIGPFGSQLKKEMLLSDGVYRVYGQENVYEHDFSFNFCTASVISRFYQTAVVREE